MNLPVSENSLCKRLFIRSSLNFWDVHYDFSRFTPIAPCRIICIRRSQYFPHPNHVESGQGEHKVAFRVDLANDSHLAHTSDCLESAEYFLNALSDSNTNVIALMSIRSSINVELLRDVDKTRFESFLQKCRDHGSPDIQTVAAFFDE